MPNYEAIQIAATWMKFENNVLSSQGKALADGTRVTAVEVGAVENGDTVLQISGTLFSKKKFFKLSTVSAPPPADEIAYLTAHAADGSVIAYYDKRRL